LFAEWFVAGELFSVCGGIVVLACEQQGLNSFGSSSSAQLIEAGRLGASPFLGRKLDVRITVPQRKCLVIATNRCVWFRLAGLGKKLAKAV